MRSANLANACSLLGLGVLICTFSAATIAQTPIPIKQKQLPGYAPLAVQARIEGDVQLVAEVNRDGTVISVHGSGAHPLLCKIAEENLRQWKFGPFSTEQQFPAVFKIVFSYRIKGPIQRDIEPANVIWKLPARVEITARPREIEPSDGS